MTRHDKLMNTLYVPAAFLFVSVFNDGSWRDWDLPRTVVQH